MVVRFYSKHRDYLHAWKNFFNYVRTQSPKMSASAIQKELEQFDATFTNTGTVYFKKQSDFAMFILRWA